MSSYELQSVFPTNVMDMGSLFKNILGAILNYKRTAHVKGPLFRLKMTVA